MTERPFRFGLVAGVADLSSFVDLARQAEDLGFDTVLTPDPLMGKDPMTVVSAAFAVTSTLHVGTFVLVDAFRDRRMLDWQARSLHELSGGRFELGIGTGRPDNGGFAERLGVPYDSPGRRVGELAETVGYLKAQADRPPLMLAAGGPKMQSLATREADILALAWMPNTTESAARSIVDGVREKAGNRLSEIEIAANLLSVGDKPAPWLEKWTGTSDEELRRAGAVTLLRGTPEEGAETLLRRREEFGISYFTVSSMYLTEFAAVIERLQGA
ncbi:oxidoreductase [Prauserella marina]|uniref:Probable F420-dependent oxidoreductase, MSMEG_2516 family n=1 Tax=Prauserella marina TaxID=530584 RepID=A0A222VWS2_9PSEU|nr:LLM class flavin-dependent oxidoreductase [Prauserella marina]ASR38153.1 oxidoreductase [Prauserella marina]PWV78676.1 putative F420-dependent oxidoreductase [Prauserella marina]SDC91294.1 probable F420-dependent oxidoreductase, MSMEG_2516 family [Prauserella marina]